MNDSLAATPHAFPKCWTAAVFAVVALMAGLTVAGPGLTWDEPAYRGSQIRLQAWGRELLRTGDRSLLGAAEIDYWWEFNRLGPNFHPPMGSYLNLLTHFAAGRWIDDVASRRLASALEFAGVCACLAHFVGRRRGVPAGLFAAAALATMPRVMGDAHVIGTDMPMLLFWTLAAAVFPAALERRGAQILLAFLLACGLNTKFSAVLALAPLGLWWLATLRSAGWRRRWQLPVVLLVATPLFAVLLNPTWWHDPAGGLLKFLDLNVDRRNKLPDISIYYLGKQHLFSLPWHNAYVLMGLTIPFGALFLGAAGLCRAAGPNAALERYCALHALALPCFRMLPTPAHDGVRLFLPTFVFWAALAGLAAARWCGAARWRWALAAALAPGWAAAEWLRIHPHELSYYNVGLRAAMRLGAEPTYWYDAVTPAVLADLNDGPRKLPRGVEVVHLDPLINTEVFPTLQELGKLRADVGFGSARLDGKWWAWLLTHSSEATPQTRLAYALDPWQHWGTGGVRLFSVLDARAVNVAFALASMTIERGQMSRSLPGRLVRPEPLVLHAAAFAAPPAVLRAALADYRGRPAADPAAAELAAFWRRSPYAKLYLQIVEAADPKASDIAVELLVSRGADLRRVSESPGYLLPEDFGGWLPVPRD